MMGTMWAEAALTAQVPEVVGVCLQEADCRLGGLAWARAQEAARFFPEAAGGAPPPAPGKAMRFVHLQALVERMPRRVKSASKRQALASDAMAATGADAY